MDSIISRQNYKINQKEIGDGKVQVYKTPQIRSANRLVYNNKIEKFRNIMANQGLSSNPGNQSRDSVRTGSMARELEK